MSMSIVVRGVRPRVLRRGLALVGLGAVLAAGVVTMPAARADGVLSHVEVAYVNSFHGAVCRTIDRYPTEAGVVGVMQGIMADGFSAGDSVDVINASVSQYCDQFWPLLQAIGAKARGEISSVRAI